MPKEYPLHRHMEFGALTDSEREAVAGLADAPRKYARTETIRDEGSVATGYYFLIEGWATASVTLPDGGRQILKIHLPGDSLGTPSMSVSHAAETLTALTDTWVGAVPFERFGRLFTTHPRIAAFFLLSVQRERVSLMDQLASMGRTSSEARLAALLLDLADRLALIGAVENDSFRLMLTQEQIGDVLGLTSVHINRTVRELEQRGLIARKRQVVTILDRARLARLAARPGRRLRTDLAWLPPAA